MLCLDLKEVLRRSCPYGDQQAISVPVRCSCLLSCHLPLGYESFCWALVEASLYITGHQPLLLFSQHEPKDMFQLDVPKR